MSTHAQRSAVLATKISTKAEDALSGLDREMDLMKWPAEFRAIMWESVAIVATSRAQEARAVQRKAAKGETT